MENEYKPIHNYVNVSNSVAVAKEFSREPTLTLQFAPELIQTPSTSSFGNTELSVSPTPGSLRKSGSLQMDKMDIIITPKAIGCITSRSLNLFYKDAEFNDNNSHSGRSKYIEMPIYYMDYLSINRDKDTKKISRKMLQTHEYNQRIRNPKVLVSLIKKEIELFDGLIPLVEYPTYTFHLRNIHFPKLPPHYEVLQINKENIDILLDFLHLQKYMNGPLAFEIMAIPDIGNIIALISKRLLYVYCLRNSMDIYGLYFIKDAKMKYEDLDNGDSDTLQCVASIANCESNRLFYLG